MVTILFPFDNDKNKGGVSAFFANRSVFLSSQFVLHYGTFPSCGPISLPQSTFIRAQHNTHTQRKYSTSTSNCMPKCVHFDRVQCKKAEEHLLVAMTESFLKKSTLKSLEARATEAVVFEHFRSENEGSQRAETVSTSSR